MGHLRVAAAWGLAAALVAAAGLKLAWFLNGAGAAPAVGTAPAYLAAATAELMCAVALIHPRTRAASARVIAGGFAGAGLVTTLVALSTGVQQPCKCLGSIRTPHGVALMLQGGVVIVASWVCRGIPSVRSAGTEAPVPGTREV